MPSVEWEAHLERSLNTDLQLSFGQIRIYLGLATIGNDGETGNSVAATQQHQQDIQKLCLYCHGWTKWSLSLTTEIEKEWKTSCTSRHQRIDTSVSMKVTHHTSLLHRTGCITHKGISSHAINMHKTKANTVWNHHDIRRFCEINIRTLPQMKHVFRIKKTLRSISAAATQ